MKILIISAHPDDEILGCGATILKHVENGDEVSVCIVTTSTHPRWSDEYRERKLIEAKNVDRILGIKNRFYCNLRTTELSITPGAELNKSLTEVIQEVDPDTVYTHFYGDINSDHVEIFNSAMVCTRPISKKVSLGRLESSKEYLAENKIQNEEENLIEVLNISVRDLNKDDIIVRELPKSTTGVVVTQILNDSPLAFLEVNDVIVELQKKKISSAKQFNKMVKNIISKGEKTLLFAVYNSNNQRSYLTVTIQ